MSGIRKALLHANLMHYSLRFIGLISTMVISRLLTPSEVGTFAIASASAFMLNEFKLLGANAWLIREKNLSSDKIGQALALTILVSWAIGLGMFGFAQKLSEYFNIGALEQLFKILSIGFFLAPYISIPMALLSRNYEYKQQMIITVSGNIAGLFIVVILIKNGFSYYSLAWGYSASMIIQFMLVRFYIPEDFTPIPNFKGISTVARFGIINSLSGMMMRASTSISDIIIGKLGTTYQVGIFSRGLGFVDFVTSTLVNGLSSVALPYLSAEKRAGGDIGDAYIRASTLTGALVWPVLAVISIASLPAIRLFFGDQWDFAATLSSALAIWAMLKTPHWFANQLLIASGKEGMMLLKESCLFVLLGFGIATLHERGLIYIAYVFIFIGFLDFTLSSIILKITNNILFWKFVGSWWKNIILTTVCSIATLVIGTFIQLDDTQAWKPIICITLLVPFIWLATLHLIKHHLYNELFTLFNGILPLPRRRNL
ncbi:oligosaccharide flippase family protein [Marinobacter salinisoli]|uniref:Oligosaccharide flippase family protein n=1 Tax=Marinobacter salinisoli TaxID=2769486 RepID=A0ABX7MMS2_9GAMM|nr:oligosaccharide flippase family protein [Marinobacter salinisoli]QSP93525.1 oligosaccharide flippase family protein [Marinobacter salinisoli]